MPTVVSTNNPFYNQSANEAIWRLTRVMKKAGWTTVACSNTSAKVAPATNNTDNWGNNADPMLDTYPALLGGTGAVCPWIVMRGPSTVKIPLTAAPTGNPLRGEKITQTGGIEGELLGYVFDSVGGTGWMVVAPRTGTFSTGSNITCATSGATFTPTGTIVTYVREFMFSRNNGSANDQLNHQIFYICADAAAESAQLFSSLAATSGASTTVPPGCSASAPNQFPALGIVVRGVSGTPNSTSSSSPFGGNTTLTYGVYHAGCANAVGAANTSPDGSFYLAGTGNTVTISMAGFCFMRVDDADPGDCDPYVAFATSSVGVSSWVRTTNTSSTAGTSYTYGGACVYSGLAVFFGYQARGCPVTARDVTAAYIGTYHTNGISGVNVMSTNYPSVNRQLNHPSVTPPFYKDNVMIWTPGNANFLKHYKGRLRWMWGTNFANISDTLENKKLICVSSPSTFGAQQAIVIGPWDGVTIPN